MNQCMCKPTHDLKACYCTHAVLGMGVFGSGLATTIAQYVSCGALCVLLVHKDMLRLQVRSDKTDC